MLDQLSEYFVFFKPDFSESIEEVLEAVYEDEEVDEMRGAKQFKSMECDTALNYINRFNAHTYSAGYQAGYYTGYLQGNQDGIDGLPNL
jgi:Zn-dependent oligopeptidase